MIVGTAGHIDHGKTALIKALTGIDADRLAEEKARGITIDLGFAYLPRSDGEIIGFIDVPGHERFVHTMLAGAHGIDFVLLVIAADDGVMPQTTEHLEILDLLGLDRGLVVLSKADLVDAETLLLRQLEIAEALRGTTLEGADIIPASVISGEGIATVLARLDREFSRIIARDTTRAFRLAIDRSFILAGAGTVVTGTVLDGSIGVGDAVIISPSGLPARIRSIHAQNRPATQASAGDRAALNLAGPEISKPTTGRGNMVLAPAIHAPTARIDAELRVSTHEKKPLGQSMPVRLHHATSEVGARLVHLADPPAPGAIADVQLILDHPIAACARDRFILRDASQTRTLGGGRFLDLRPPLRARRSPQRERVRNALRTTDAAAVLSGLLAEPPHMLPLAGFLTDRGLPLPAGSHLIRQLGLGTLRVEGADHVVPSGTLEALVDALVTTLHIYHSDHPDEPGSGLERLRRHLAPKLTPAQFHAVARRMQQDSRLVLDGAWARLPDHSVAISAADAALWADIQPLLGGETRFRPPRVRDIAVQLALDEASVRAVLRRLQRAGQVDEIAHDHFFVRATTAEMVALLRDLSATRDDHWFSAAEFRDLLGNGRKVAIQILEFFDSAGVTLRRGDRRRPNPHQLDLFQATPSGSIRSEPRDEHERREYRPSIPNTG